MLNELHPRHQPTLHFGNIKADRYYKIKLRPTVIFDQINRVDGRTDAIKE
jgi:hypothetical protein